MGESIVEKLRRDKDIEKLPWDSIKELIEKTESTLYGNILQNVIALQFIKDREAKVELPKQLTYYDKSFMAERTGTMDLLCKLRLPVRGDGINKAAGIDLVVEDEDIITLIKIENSTVADEHQIQWLNNEDAKDYLEKEILRGREAEKKVYYLGEPKKVGDISYENIADVLIEHYESYRQAVK